VAHSCQPLTFRRGIDLIPILWFIKESHLYLVVIFVLLAFLSISPISTGVADESELMTLILGIEDPHINVNDLAFLLVTHDFNAAPKGDHVEVRLNNTIYKLAPNGPYPGLANVTIESSDVESALRPKAV
jgi:hypothetical protein